MKLIRKTEYKDYQPDGIGMSLSSIRTIWWFLWVIPVYTKYEFIPWN